MARDHLLHLQQPGQTNQDPSPDGNPGIFIDILFVAGPSGKLLNGIVLVNVWEPSSSDDYVIVSSTFLRRKLIEGLVHLFGVNARVIKMRLK